MEPWGQRNYTRKNSCGMRIILLVFFVLAALLVSPAGKAVQAADLSWNMLSALPNSTPGQLTITWYSAKRFVTYSGLASLFSFMSVNGVDRPGQIGSGLPEPGPLCRH